MTVPTRSNVAAAAIAADIIDALVSRFPEVARGAQAALSSEIDEIRDDPRLSELLPETVVANIDTVFTAIRNELPIENFDAPAVALEYARRLARHDISAYVLVRAYRLGHQYVLDLLLNEIRGRGLDTHSALGVAEWITDITFRYIDRISVSVIATYHEERDRWQASRTYVRAENVRDILAGGDVDADAITKAIGYPLRRTHLAMVVWSTESTSDDETVAIERFVHKVAREVGDDGLSLLVPADRSTAWAWIPLSGSAIATAADRVRTLVEASSDGLRVALGMPLPGPDGFRRSHAQAAAARAVAARAEDASAPVVASDEPGVLLTSLLSADIDSARDWVGEVLGPLATASENDARLRETLRTFLRTGSSFKASAAELHLHFNTVRYRVERAVRRRGRDIGDDRLDVEVALLLCNLLGAAVLTAE